MLTAGCLRVSEPEKLRELQRGVKYTNLNCWYCCYYLMRPLLLHS